MKGGIAYNGIGTLLPNAGIMMVPVADDLLLQLLRAVAASAPGPLYPGAFAASAGLERAALDQALDQLRLRGLVRLTDWVKGKGQGYALTPEGTLVLDDPTLLNRPRRTTPARDKVPSREDTPWSRGEAVRDALLNPARPVVCMTLLGLNIAVFVIGLFLALHEGAGLNEYLGSGAGNPQGALVVGQIRDEFGALVPWEVLARNQWWRLLGYAFVHAGLLHLAMNMYFLFSLGPLLEAMWGSVRFLILYLVGALTGGCAVLLMNRLAVGASGALCGLLTSLGVWIYLNRDSLPPRRASSWMRAVFTNIILIAFMSTLPRVSWEGHLGGALGGALVSVPLNSSRFGRGWQKTLGLLGVVAVPVASLALVAYALEPGVDEIKFERYLREDFANAYKKAAWTFNAMQQELLQPGIADEAKVARAPAAREAIQKAQDAVQRALDTFDELAPYHDPELTQAVAQATDYLEQWSKYYVLSAQMLAKPPPWPDEQITALTDQKRNIDNAGRPLWDSPYFRVPHRPVVVIPNKQAGP